MGVHDLFSRRNRPDKKLSGMMYDKIPMELRVQIIHIWQDVIGDPEERLAKPANVKMAYQFIHEVLCHEYGKFQLTQKYDKDYSHFYYLELKDFFLREADINRVLDVIELSFKVINTVTRNFDYCFVRDASPKADEAIIELNFRMKENGIGYRFESNQIIRVDSDLTYKEVIEPALKLLKTKEYKGANDEFLAALHYYRKGEFKECLNNCLKSFESMMKIICEINSWEYDQKDTAKKLLDICFNNGLISEFWQTHFSAFRSMLESGIPTGRNRLSGHGQGPEIIEIPPYIVSFMITSTAATLILLHDANIDTIN